MVNQSEVRAFAFVAELDASADSDRRGGLCAGTDEDDLLEGELVTETSCSGATFKAGRARFPFAWELLTRQTDSGDAASRAVD